MGITQQPSLQILIPVRDAVRKHKWHEYNPLGTQVHLQGDKLKQELPNSQEP